MNIRILYFLAIAAAFSIPGYGAPQSRILPLAADELISQVSEAEILATATALQGFGTRQVGYQGNIDAAAYIYDRFAAIPGLSVAYQGGNLRNVVATLPGTDAASDKVYIVGAHYDSWSTTPTDAPGAIDDGCGVGIVLELARIMSRYQFKNDLKFAAWNSEEFGRIGSTDYATDAALNLANIQLYVNYDTAGYDPDGRNVVDINFDAASAGFADRLTQLNNSLGLGLTAVYNLNGCSSDHKSFWEQGYQAVFLHSETHGPIHSPDDTVDKISTPFAKKEGQLGLALLAESAELAGRSSSWDTGGSKHAVGDFDGDGTAELAVDFGALGAWLYNGGGWMQLTTLDPESLSAADVDGDPADELLADLGDSGLWLRNGASWNMLSGMNAEGAAAFDADADAADEVAGDFGAAGLWLYDSGTWTEISGANADSQVRVDVDGSAGEEIVGEFGPAGLWLWRAGAWEQLSAVNADGIAPGNTDGLPGLEPVVDFGAAGLWFWSAAVGWTQTNGGDVDGLITADTDNNGLDEIIGDFGPAGVWLWNGNSWNRLSGSDPDFMIRANVDSDGQDEIAADFGPAGIWLWNGGTWSQLTGSDPELILAGDLDGDSREEIIADLGGLGLWLWNQGTWIRISPDNPD